MKVIHLSGFGATQRLLGKPVRRYSYHMRFVCLLWLAGVAAGAERLAQVRQRGAVLEANRQWPQAAAMYQDALEGLGSEAEPKDRFWLLTSLAEVAFERQDYQGARGWLRQAGQLVSKPDGNTSDYIRLLNAWGTLYLVEGNLTAAERELSKAATLSETGTPSPELAAALHNLAAVEMQTGRLKQAAAHQQQALAIWRQHFGDRNHYVMKAWISLSSLQGLLSDWRGAAGSLERALSIRETPEALANYAIVLEKLKRGKEAKEIRRRLKTPLPAPAALVDVKALPYEGSHQALRTR